MCIRDSSWSNKRLAFMASPFSPRSARACSFRTLLLMLSKQRVTMIDRTKGDSKSDYDVKLDNGVKLRFNKNFDLLSDNGNSCLLYTSRCV